MILRLTLEPLCASLPPAVLSPCLLAASHCSNQQQLRSFVLLLVRLFCGLPVNQRPEWRISTHGAPPDLTTTRDTLESSRPDYTGLTFERQCPETLDLNIPGRFNSFVRRSLSGWLIVCSNYVVES